jgi:DNA-binding MarR family transcriptional regulator
MQKDEGLIGRLIETLEQFRGIDAEMPVQAMLTFLHVARKEGQSGTELAKVLDLADSSLSRNLTALSSLNRHKQPGLDLVAYDYNPVVDARTKAATLTTKGRQFLSRALAPLQR